jgi:hypothetical protein
VRSAQGGVTIDENGTVMGNVTLRKDPNLHTNQRPRKRATTTLPATVAAAG